jgi:uncharacterized protein (TIGR03086 family)
MTDPLPSDRLLGLLGGALDVGEAVFEGIADDRRAAATPCAGFDVDALAAHLVGGLTWFGTLPEGGPADPRTLPDPDLAGRPLDAPYRAAAALVRRNWTPESLTSSFALPSGPTRGAGLAEYMVVEVLGHGWDLAVASGQRCRLPEDLAEAALRLAVGLGEAALRAPGMLGPSVAVPSGAPASDRLIAFLGRDPATGTAP